MRFDVRGRAAAVPIGCCALLPAADLKPLHANVAAFIDRTENTDGR